jgi:tetratricopeptide (TPR) repeat protein
MLVKLPAEGLCGTYQDLWPVKAAWGYCDLNMFQEALDELGRVPPELKNTEVVLSLRGTVLLALERWDELIELASLLVKERAEVVQYWIWLGHAMRMLDRHDEAEIMMNEAVILHPFEPMIYFTLACCASRQGDIRCARTRLVSALALDYNICFIAMADPDLQFLWADLDNDIHD